MDGGIGLGGEAVERGASGAEIGEWSEREVLVFELLGHRADDGTDVVVVFIGGVAEF